MTNENTKNGYIITITHFDDAPDRVAVPFAIANNALAMGQDVIIWLTLDAVKIAKKDGANGLIPESFPAITDLMDTYIENGGKFGVCPPCAKTHDVTEDDLVENAEWMGAPALLEASQNRQAVWF